MGDIFYIVFFLYLLPMIINIFFCYTDKDVYTLGDLMKNWWAYFIPFINLFTCLMIPIYYVHFLAEIWWEKLKNTKIK